jgi:PAS domain S-box-containing protein
MKQNVSTLAPSQPEPSCEESRPLGVPADPLSNLIAAGDGKPLKDWRPATPEMASFPRLIAPIRYGLAVVIVAVATAARVWLLPIIGSGPTFITWYPAVMIAASIGGGGPGVLATLLSAIAADYFLLPPYGMGISKLGDVIALALFVACGLFISVLARRLHRARWTDAVNVGLRQANETLEQINEEMQAREEEIAVQNEELQRQSEELQQQSEELQQQSEELLSQNEELEVQSDALRASEHRVRAKLDSILAPEGDIGTLDLADVIDVQAVQSLVDDLYNLSGFPVGIIDLKGRVLIGAGWQDICTKYHRVNPDTCRHCIESDTQLSAGVPVGEFRVYKCKNNMWDIATPIVVGGQHVGNIFSGQFFFEGETPDLDLFRAQAKRYGFDEDEYLAALGRVPRFSRETVKAGMSSFAKLANMLSLLSYSNIKLARSLTERDSLTRSLRESEAGLRRLNRTFMALGKSNQALVRASDETSLLNEVCRIVVEDCGHAMVWIGYAEDDEAKSIRPVACAGFEEGYLETLKLTWADTDRGRGPTGTAIRTGQPSACRDMLADPQFLPWREEAIRRGYASSLVIPLMDGEKAFGALTIYSREPDAFTPHEVELLGTLCSNLAYGIKALRVRAAHADAERAVRQSEERFRSMFERHQAVMLLIDPHSGTIVDANAAAAEYYGYSREHLRAMRIEELNELTPEEIALGRQSILDGQRSHFVFPHRLAGGETRWGEVYSTPFETQGTSLLFSIIHDITDRKRMEEEIREGHDRLAFALEGGQAGAFEWDIRSGRIIWGRRSLEIFGCEKGDSLTYELWRGRVHPDDLSRVEDTIAKSLRERGDYLGEYRIRWPNGEVRWVRSAGRYSYDSEGAPISCIGVNFDITASKRAEEEMRLAKEEAEAANAAKDHFLAVLSHELRTPLAPVLMTASALEGDASVPEWVREDMGLIRRSVDLEVRLIDDLLDLNRISRGKLELRMETLDAHAKIMAAVDICRLDAREKGLVLETNLGATESHVSGDGGRLQQALWNLLKNAIKFTPKGGQVTIRSFNRAGMFCVEVVDTGIGISTEALASVFTAFEQGGKQVTRQFGGLGLGLAISKALVEMHGGRISGASEGPGKGATFTIELPTIAKRDVPRPKLGSRSGRGGRKLRVLLVEDNAATLMVLEKLLTRVGHDVCTAGNIRDGLKLALESELDLVISDLGLPDGSGLELMRELRPMKPDLPAIALSGYGMEQDIERSKEAGFTEHLTKPVELSTLEAAIARVKPSA